MSRKTITIALTQSEANSLFRTVKFLTKCISAVRENVKYEERLRRDLANINSAAEKIATELPEVAS